MSEETNIPKENSKQDKAAENISPPETIAQTEPQAENSKLQTESMEVHHHPNVEKKNFKEYLLEGLMIFIAVTMGFIAETIRENITENKIASELAESLYKEAYSDSIVIQQKIEHRLMVEAHCDYFIKYVKDSSLTNPSEEFFTAFVDIFISLDANIFEPKDGILNQLKNSGALRYFKSNKLQEDLGEFSVAVANIRIRNEQDFGFTQNFKAPFAVAHVDFATLHDGRIARNMNKDFFKAHPDSLSIFGTPKTQATKNLYYPKILNIDQFNRVDAMNLVAMSEMIMEGTRLGRYQTYVEKNHALLETLRKEYPVTNE